MDVTVDACVEVATGAGAGAGIGGAAGGGGAVTGGRDDVGGVMVVAMRYAVATDVCVMTGALWVTTGAGAGVGGANLRGAGT